MTPNGNELKENIQENEYKEKKEKKKEGMEWEEDDSDLLADSSANDMDERLNILVQFGSITFYHLFHPAFLTSCLVPLATEMEMIRFPGWVSFEKVQEAVRSRFKITDNECIVYKYKDRSENKVKLSGEKGISSPPLPPHFSWCGYMSSLWHFVQIGSGASRRVDQRLPCSFAMGRPRRLALIDLVRLHFYICRSAFMLILPLACGR